MNEAWAWRPLEELFEIGTGKTISAAARKGSDKHGPAVSPMAAVSVELSPQLRILDLQRTQPINPLAHYHGRMTGQHGVGRPKGKAVSERVSLADRNWMMPSCNDLFERSGVKQIQHDTRV